MLKRSSVKAVRDILMSVRDIDRPCQTKKFFECSGANLLRIIWWTWNKGGLILLDEQLNS